MRLIRIFVLFLLCWMVSVDAGGQTRPIREQKPIKEVKHSDNKKDISTDVKFSSTSVKNDTIDDSFLRIVSADQQIFDARGEDERFISAGKVRITHDSVFMFCDTAVLVNGTNLEAKGNISIIKNDTIRIFSDSLLYQSDSMMAYFVGNVVLEDGNKKLFTSFLQYDLEKDWAIYTDTALLITGGMEIKSKRGIFHLDEDYVNFYEKVTIEGDGFDLLSDSLRYYTGIEKAVFLSPTLINQEGKKIYSEGGYYDIDDNISEFFGNAQIIDGETTSTADTIRNNGSQNVSELIGNAVYKSEIEEGRAERIISKSKTGEIELVGDAYFENPENKVTGEKIYFNQKSNDLKVSGRSRLSNPPMIIIADDLDYRKDSGLAFADGNVIWQDTSANYEIICDHARYIDSTDYMKAYNNVGKPVLKNAIDESDTLFLSGDTLISYTLISELDSVSVDTHRYFQAFEHVELLNFEMQGVCDSLSYSGEDDLFQLFGSPVMWADSSQYSGDSIKMKMNNSKLKQVDLLGDGMILSSSDFKYFDQIRGKVINAYFSSGEIEKMDVIGGSESVYYMKDENDAYSGVNTTQCTNMVFHFEEGELLQTRYYKEPVSKMIPMAIAKHESLKLSGFSWQIIRRPLTVNDLFD